MEFLYKTYAKKQKNDLRIEYKKLFSQQESKLLWFFVESLEITVL